MKTSPSHNIFLNTCLPILYICISLAAHAQDSGSMSGHVLDQNGRLIPNARVSLMKSAQPVREQTSTQEGSYVIGSVLPGTYTLVVEAPGFTTYRADIAITTNDSRKMDVTLHVETQHTEISVSSQQTGLGVSPDQNASSMVLAGNSLDALSDDPTVLSSELQGLAGPSAGPSGGELYIDGFTGGEMPPKSSIRQIRINQNPFSAEYDRVGYGRVEILTKPGAEKLSGHVTSVGFDSALNSSNPLVQQQPTYYSYLIQADITGPLSKHTSYFASFIDQQRQNQGIVDATNPIDPSLTLQQAYPDPSSLLVFSPRLDLQLGQANTISIRDAFSHSAEAGAGVGGLYLTQQAYSIERTENALQISDTVVAGPNIINETHFQWRRITNKQSSASGLPSITVQGSFIKGGNAAAKIVDRQNDFELQNYSTIASRRHTIRFGSRARVYGDDNYSTSGSNGAYSFTSFEQYVARSPAQYHSTIVTVPRADTTLFDGAVFYQDDWKYRSNLVFSYGLRYEGQNRIHDYHDVAPRLSVTWAPGSRSGAPRNVVHAGYGWFYDRFTVPNSFVTLSSTPYIAQAIHDNGVNQTIYILDDPSFYNPSNPIIASTLVSSGAHPTITTLAPNFHAALSMQGGVGIDHQVGKQSTLSLTYLQTRGIHQYFSNEINAPEFDASTYTVSGAQPGSYNQQFQSGGVFNETQFILTSATSIGRLAAQGSYTYTYAKSDTSGVTYFPSVASRPGLDYGRATFDVHHRIFLITSFAAPFKVSASALFMAQSGTPFNITTGNDFTGNNQFNARPTYGTCGASGVISTAYGCLDESPIGKRERIVPFNLGNGPADIVLHMRLSKTIGIGPHVHDSHGNAAYRGGNGVDERGLGGKEQVIKLDASVPRRFSLTFIAGANNILNIVNRGTPDGVLNSPLFGTSQTLADGAFTSPTPGNRSVFLQTVWSF